MIVYCATNKINGKSYIGMTKTSLEKRRNSHHHSVKSGSKSYFHNAIRKYGPDNFEWRVVAYCPDESNMKHLEEILIRYYKYMGCYNIADGGNGGFVVPDNRVEEWKNNLRKARKGRKPSLGMKHTEENKKFFAECNKRKKLLYDGIDFSKISFNQAHRDYGISKTHYYRLRKVRTRVT